MRIKICCRFHQDHLGTKCNWYWILGIIIRHQWRKWRLWQKIKLKMMTTIEAFSDRPLWVVMSENFLYVSPKSGGRYFWRRHAWWRMFIWKHVSWSIVWQMWWHHRRIVLFSGWGQRGIFLSYARLARGGWLLYKYRKWYNFSGGRGILQTSWFIVAAVLSHPEEWRKEWDLTQFFIN